MDLLEKYTGRYFLVAVALFTALLYFRALKFINADEFKVCFSGLVLSFFAGGAYAKDKS